MVGTDGADAAQEQAPDPLVAADAVAAEPVIGAELDSGKKWDKTLIIAGGGRLGANEKRAVIVTEARIYTLYDTLDEAAKDGIHATDGSTMAVKKVELKLDGYATKADLYYRTDPDVQFGGDAPVLTLGVNVEQGLFWGFSPEPRWVHVGPAHPAYAAANLAWQRGAKEIEIVGLSDFEKSKLQPYFDALPEGGPRQPAGFVDIRCPAGDVKITLS